MAAYPKYLIKSQLSEKQIEADVAHYFGWISQGAPFRLLDVNEQLTGADKKFVVDSSRGFAFLLQFKVSHGLYSVNIVPPSNRKNRSQLEEIREFRKNHGLGDNPTLFFELRKKAKKAHDFQHNILMKFARQPSSEAFYVAPLHLDENQYYNSLFNSVNRFKPSPFNFRSYHLKYQYHFRKWVSYFYFVPYLKEHISIIPHERINTHQHYYSYSITGDDIVWHSPEIISRIPLRLSDTLEKIIRKHVEENMLFEISKINSDLKIDEIRTNEELDPFEQLQAKAKELNQKYSIKLILFLIDYEYQSKYLV